MDEVLKNKGLMKVLNTPGLKKLTDQKDVEDIKAKGLTEAKKLTIQ